MSNINLDEQKQALAAELFRYVQRSPVRPPNWRWRLAELVYVHPDQKKLIKDDLTKKVTAFVKKLYDAIGTADTKALSKVYNRWPDLFTAWQIYEHAKLSRVKAELEARILADQDPALITKKTTISEDTYNWYIAAFFDVKDRLENVSYILNNVILRDVTYFSLESEERLLPFIGYFFKQEAIDYITTRLENEDWKKFRETIGPKIQKYAGIRLWIAVNSEDKEKVDILYKLFANLKGEEGTTAGRDFVDDLCERFGWRLPARSSHESQGESDDKNSIDEQQNN